MRKTPLGRLRAVLSLGLLSLTLVFTIVSCQTMDPVALVPPNIPGATFIGSKECEQCHEDIYRGFQTAPHARLQAQGPNAINIGCESCHGPGSLHAQSGGDRSTAYQYKPGGPYVLSSSQLQAIINPRQSSEFCLDCHLDKRGQFNLPYHHPVPEQQIRCGDCHDPHKGPAVKGGTTLRGGNDVCLKCHTVQQGPYVFEHEAMREGCTTCHSPHGSINAKMLALRDSTLCLKCHFQQVRAGRVLIGGSDHTVRVQQGTCWTGGCHEAVHGSHVSSSLRF